MFAICVVSDGWVLLAKLYTGVEMLSKEKEDNIISLANNLTSVPIDKLVTNANWGTINFEAARNDLQLTYDLCGHIKVLPIALLPDSVGDAFATAITQAGASIEKIKTFTVESGNPPGTRDQIVNEVKTLAERLLTTTKDWIPFLAYQKGDIQKNIDALTSTISEAKQILDSSKVEVENKRKEVDGIVTAAREASASAGVGVFTSDFDGQATTLNGEAGDWLKYTLGFAVLTLIAAFASFYFPIASDATNAQIAQYLTSKLVILLVLLTATIWCGRIYKALMHQVTVNKHRANSLKTFQAFVKAASDEGTRDAVLIETTRSIFTNAPSGYLETAEPSQDAGTRVLEIVKGAVDGNRG